MRFTKTALAVSLAATAAATQAADVGQCATPASMTEMLKAEDQHSIVTADMITRDKRLYGVIVTMSGDRKTGYILKADRPLGDPANQLCVYNRLATIRLFDARKPGIDPAVLLRAQDSDAAAHCDALVKAGETRTEACWPLNAVIRRNEPSAQRVVLQARAQDGTLVTLTGRIGGRMADDPDHPEKGILGHIYLSSLPDGATAQNATLVYVEYTPYGGRAVE